MNPKIEKLKVALAAAKETIKTLKNDLRTLAQRQGSCDQPPHVNFLNF